MWGLGGMGSGTPMPVLLKTRVASSRFGHENPTQLQHGAVITSLLGMLKNVEKVGQDSSDPLPMSRGGKHFIDAGNRTTCHLLDALKSLLAGNRAAAKEGIDQQHLLIELNTGHEMQRRIHPDNRQPYALCDHLINKRQRSRQPRARLKHGRYT